MKPASILFILGWLIALAGCNQPAPAIATATPVAVTATLPVPTFPPTVTQISTAISTQAPVRTATQAATLALPTATRVPPTATRVPPTATNLPPTATSAAGFPQKSEAILIQVPGLTSSIVSPVTISGQADTTFEQNLVAKVVGENGLMISSNSTTIQTEMGKRGPFSVSLPFTITKEQPGRVAVYDTSPKDGGLIHFSSVEITLKTGGGAVIKAGQQQNEVLVITQPAPVAAISGGKLHIEGWSGPVFENALVVILCGEGGSGKADPFCGTADNILAKAPVTMQAPDVGQPGPFSLDLAFKVSQPVNGRVAVYFTSARDGGLLHLASVPVLLRP